MVATASPLKVRSDLKGMNDDLEFQREIMLTLKLINELASHGVGKDFHRKSAPD